MLWLSNRYLIAKFNLIKIKDYSFQLLYIYLNISKHTRYTIRAHNEILITLFTYL